MPLYHSPPNLARTLSLSSNTCCWLGTNTAEPDKPGMEADRLPGAEFKEKDAGMESVVLPGKLAGIDSVALLSTPEAIAAGTDVLPVAIAGCDTAADIIAGDGHCGLGVPGMLNGGVPRGETPSGETKREVLLLPRLPPPPPTGARAAATPTKPDKLEVRTGIGGSSVAVAGS